ncbi:MAG TPA: pirin family protein [Gammaproteobacteria bacterium]|nr:pirin family protein [Gammaproteobacteria bacterium]
MSNAERRIARIVNAHRQREGGGFIVRRPFPTMGLDAVDPFLLIDEMGPADYGPGEAVGAPDHPHRGFETVTYMIEGEFEHEDSAGHRGTLRPGDVQWMTAGAGIIHSEMPSAEIRRAGGRVHGFQIWVNLPAADKLMRPRYQELSSEQIPTAKSEDGLAQAKVVAGTALGVKAAIDTRIPIVFQDWTLKPGADVVVDIPASEQAMVYVFEGAMHAGTAGDEVRDGQLGVFGEGGTVRLANNGKHDARFLLLAGAPINEPVARYGPFVMNNEDELRQAFEDFRSGRMGAITREAQVG